jgi:hypothetical protein
MTAPSKAGTVLLGGDARIEGPGGPIPVAVVPCVYRLAEDRGIEAPAAAQTAAAMAEGHDAVAYVVDCACPGVLTPMQYGGHYLELDRAVLEPLVQMSTVVLWARGHEPYLDVLAGLPHTILAWSRAETGLGRGDVETPGLTATDDGLGDYVLEVRPCR